MSKPSTGGSIEAGPPSNPGPDLLNVGLLELIIRQRRTSTPDRDQWEIGTPTGPLRGRLAYYSVAPDGEATLTMFTLEPPNYTDESVIYIPLSQITYVRMFSRAYKP